MFMLNFSSLALANSKKKNPNLSTQFYIYLINLANHVHAEYQLSTLYPDGLRQIFEENSKKFQENSLANGELA
jgi:hypothetical protein